MATLSDLRLAIRQRVDIAPSGAIKDSDLTNYINGSAAELYGLIIDRFEDYFWTSFQFTLSSGQDGYQLPVQILKLRGVDFQLNGDWVTMHDFTFEERNRWNHNTVLATFFGDVPRYRRMGDKLWFRPVSEAAGTYQIHYIPAWQDLVNDSDPVYSLENWHEYIIVDACIKVLARREKDPSVFMAQKQAMMKRIEIEAANRDVGSPAKITDVRGQESDPWIGGW